MFKLSAIIIFKYNLIFGLFMFGYNAKDGLNILKYLDLQDLTQEEKKIFRKMWKGAYKLRKDPVLATKLLYVNTLPFVCNDEKDEQIISFNTRLSLFDARLRESGLVARLAQGISLGSALKAVPARA